MKCENCENKAQFSFTYGTGESYNGVLCAACAAAKCAAYGDAGGYEYFMGKVGV